MARPIDADAVLDRYYAEFDRQDICDGSQDRDWLMRCIEEAPTLTQPNEPLTLDELEKVKAERDAAVSDLETIMSYAGNLDTCQFCKNVKCYKRGGTHPCLPKWRGPQKEA